MPAPKRPISRRVAAPLQLGAALARAWRACGFAEPCPPLEHLGGNLYRAPRPAEADGVRLLWARLSLALLRRGAVDNPLEVSYHELAPGADGAPCSLVLVPPCLVLFGAASAAEDALLPVLHPPPRPHCVALGADRPALVRSVLGRLRASFPDKLVCHRPRTTRAPRPHEGEADAVFCPPTALRAAREDPRCFNFAEFRGDWYWLDLVALLEQLAAHPERTHVLEVYKRTAWEGLQALLPSLRWVWLEADEPFPSLEPPPSEPRPHDLIELVLPIGDGTLGRTVQRLVDYLQSVHASC